MREESRRNERKKSERAITLIALIITVVILILVAGISISQISGDGLVSRTLSAREQAQIQGEKETIQAAVVQAKARNRYGKLTKDELQEELGDTDYTVAEDDDMYIITLAQTKRSYLLDKKGNISERGKWGVDYTTGRISINGEEVKSGDVYLEIGDIIVGYDPTDGATENEVISYGESTTAHPSANGYADTVFRLQPVEGDNDKQTVSYDLTKGWKLLGVTSTGNLMITTADKVSPAGGGYKSGNTYFYKLLGRTGYKYAIEELDKISNLYGQGRFAIGSRSINIDDVNKITGYNPENIDGNGTLYNEGQISEYGNKVKYSWKSDSAGYPYYSYGQGKNSVETKLTSSHNNGFYYFDSSTKNWRGPIVKTAIGDITSLTSTYYSYQRTEAKCSTKAKSLVFLDMTYVVASRMIHCQTGLVDFGLRVVGAQVVTKASAITSQGYDGANNLVVRPVVILDSNINIDYANGVWTISANN